jgi:hypothetical protein
LDFLVLLVRLNPVVRPREPANTIVIVDSIAGSEVNLPVNFVDLVSANVVDDMALPHQLVVVARVSLGVKGIFSVQYIFQKNTTNLQNL